MKQFCVQCREFFEPGDGKCPRCDRALLGTDGPNPYLSGQGSESRVPIDLKPGQTLCEDRYTIDRLLGNGAYGEVYLAEDFLRNEKVATKIVEVGPCNVGTAPALLRKEYKLLEKIKDHEHVIKTHGFHYEPWGASGLFILAMEYAEGGTFRHWLLEHGEDLDTRRVKGLELFLRMCRCVDVIHHVGRVHRDLKPENFLFVNGRLKISDLGSSGCIQNLSSQTTATPPVQMDCRGTPVYMSPEQFGAPHPDDPDKRSDIYALGIMLYELHHPDCRPPFGGSARQIEDGHLNKPVTSFPQMDEYIVNVIGRCLQKQPDDRYQTVGELIAALKHCDPQNEVVAEPSQADASPDTTSLKAQAKAAWNKPDYLLALNLYRAILEKLPNDTEAQKMVRFFEERFTKAKAIYEQCEAEFSEMGLVAIGEDLVQAANTFPNHPSAEPVISYFSIRAREYRRHMESVVAAMRGGENMTAHYRLVRLVKSGPEHPTKHSSFIDELVPVAKPQFLIRRGVEIS